MPVKGPAPWLPDTLLSLGDQTLKDWQLVASMHGADPYLSALILNSFPDAVMVESQPGGNLATTLNCGLRASSATYIARIDQDDLADRERLAKQVYFLDSNPEIAAVGTSATVIGTNGEVIGLRLQETDRAAIRRRLRWKSPLIHPSVMFRRDIVLGLGGYSEGAVNVEDYELWLRIAAVGDLGGMPECLTKYRIHPNQITSHLSIPKSATEAVRSARLALAKSQGESLLAARMRQQAWASKQVFRRIRRMGRT